ncbi:MAG: CHAT domain-containing tetratricopeptide repeat protein, partial [Pseudomonadota bacterium]
QQATKLSNLGGTQYQIGRFDQALKFYNQALDINNRINDANEQATVLGNIASLYRDQGDLQRSLDYNLRTLDIYRSRNSNQGIALVYHRLGLLFQRMGDFERSESYYTQAYELRKNSSRGRAASTLRGLASLYAQQGKHQTAQETQKQALSLFESIGSSTNQARVELELAKSALELGQVNEAATFVNRALPVLKKASLNPLVGEGTEVLGKVAASQSDLERAKQQFQEAVRLYREASNPIGEINALVGLATLEADDQQALEALQLAETTANVVRESIGNPELKARFVATTTSLYDQLITRHLNVYQETGDKGHMAKAFFVHEKSRGRSLFELLARGESSIDEPTNNRLTLRSELQKELNGLWSSNRRLNGGSNSREASSLVEQNNTKIRDLRTQLDGVYAELAQDQFGVGTQDVNLEAVQAKLGSGDRLLQIHLGEKVATLWWISSNRVEVKALPPKEDLAAQVQKAYEALIEPDFDEADQATLMGLYEVLTKDLSGFDEAKTVYLVVDGYLQYLPFAALMPRKGRFLGEDTNFVSLPAARVLLNDLEKQKFNDDTKVLVLADPVYDDVDYRAQNAGTLSRAAQAMNMERIERLPFSGMEAESIQSHAENALVVTGFDASKSYVLDQASQHDVLHFATHGIANDRNPQLSGLVLSLLDADQKPQPGFLSLLDIESLSINPSLVVLSACDTGLGEDIPLEGTMSLSRGFLAQGADQVVASLWQVNDRATAELMDSFYEGLFAKQLTVKDALRRAQSKIANTPRWRAPYFWAGFVAHAVTP